MAQNDTSNQIPLSAYVVRVTDLMARLDWFEDLLSNAYHQCFVMSAIKGEIRGVSQIQQAVETINDEHNLDINSIECPINLETNAGTIYDNDGRAWRAYVNVVDMVTSQTTVITPVKNA